MSYAANRLAKRVGVLSARRFPDRITFKSSSTSDTTDPGGGNIVGDPADSIPRNIPCRYRPASGREVQLAAKVLSGTAYVLTVPAQFKGHLVGVDATSQGVVAARPSGEPARTFNVVWIGRVEGIVIQLLGTFED